MTKKRWAILLILISVPLSYYGFSNFEAGSSDPLQAIMISLGCTGGIGCFFGGLYLFFTKTKGRGEDLLASQTKVGYSPISLALNETPEDFKDLSTADKIRQRNQAAIDNLVTKTTDNAIKTLTKKQKVNEMAKPKAKASTSVELMKREKELATRRKELESLLSEVTFEESVVETQLIEKGWVQQKDGTWSYE